MVWRGVGVLLVLVLAMPLAFADSASNIVIGSGSGSWQKIVETGPAGVYQIEADIISAAPLHGVNNVFNVQAVNSGCQNTFVINHEYRPSTSTGKKFARDSPKWGFCQTVHAPSDYDYQSTRATINPTNGDEYHVSITIDTIQNRISYNVNGGDLTYSPTPRDLALLTKGGISVFVGNRRGTQGEIGPATGWTVKSITLTGSGSPPTTLPSPISGPGDTGGTPVEPPTQIGSHGSFTSSASQGKKEFNVAGGPWGVLEIEMDITAGPARSDLFPCGDDVARCEYQILGVSRPDPAEGGSGYFTGIGALARGGNTIDEAILYGRDSIGQGSETYNRAIKTFQFVEGKTYHAKLVVDAGAHTSQLTLTGDGQSLTLSNPVPYDTSFMKDLTIRLGLDSGTTKPEIAPYGWTMNNVVVRGGQSAGTSGTQACILTQIATHAGASITTTTPNSETGVLGSGPYGTLEVDFDVTPGPQLPECVGTICRLGIFSLRSSEFGNMFDFGAKDSGSGVKEALFVNRASLTESGPAGWKGTGAPFNFISGKTYHVNVKIDTGSKSAIATITGDGQTATLRNVVPLPYTSANVVGVKAGYGGPPIPSTHTLGDPLEVAALGWSVTNVKLRGAACSASAGTSGGTYQTKNAAGFEPNEEGDGEPVELLRKDGVFFIEPWQTTCPGPNGCEKVLRIPVPTDGKAYEKIITDFDFTIDDFSRAGFYEWLAGLENTCSNQSYWNFMIKNQFENTPAKTGLHARGVVPRLLGDGTYTIGPKYHAQIVYDFLDEEVYVTITDAAGNKMHTVGDKLNSDPSNIAKVESTKDGLTMRFGVSRDYTNRLIQVPHLWPLENLVVQGVEIGGGTGGNTNPEGADLASDEGRMAFLAAHLINAAGSSEYTIDCGPGNEVLPTPPEADKGKGWCALQYDDGKIAFGTFTPANSGNTTTGEQLILESLKDELYAGQIEAGDINAAACNGIDTTQREFQECNNAIVGLHTYALVDAASKTSLLVFSEDGINAFDDTFLNKLTDFFRRIFGLDSSSSSVDMSGMPLRRFHHGYFAHVAERTVAATWLDTSSTLVYADFVTNMSDFTPTGAEYNLGSGIQVIRLEASRSSPGDVARWRKMTAALRISSIEGETIEGAQCGDGTIDFGEQCEPSVTLPTCSELFPGLSSEETATCKDDCTIDLDACFTKSGTCYDDWLEPITPAICPGGDPACPVQRSGDDGGGGDPPPPGSPCDGVTCPAGQTCDATSGTCIFQCPMTWTEIGRQGVYSFQTMEVNYKPQLRVTWSSPEDTCFDDDVDVDVNFGPFTDPVSKTEIYYRNKQYYGMRVYLSSDGKNWTIEGDPSISARADSGANVLCWHCTASGFAASCSNMVLKLPVCTPSTPPGACNPTCTGGQVCVNSACVTPTNDCSPACTSTQVCVNAVCQSASTSQCSLTNPCASGKRCMGGVCVACSGDALDTCTAGVPCCQGSCQSGVCIAPGGCFIAGTPVTTPEGDVAIETLAAGDVVLSYDESSGAIVESTIEYTTVRHVSEVLVINEHLTTTDEHPFFTQRGWVEGGALAVGDILYTIDGDEELVVSLAHEPYDGEVYNLHVTGPHHNYYAGGVLVHNKIGVDPTI